MQDEELEKLYADALSRIQDLEVVNRELNDQVIALTTDIDNLSEEVARLDELIGDRDAARYDLEEEVEDLRNENDKFERMIQQLGAELENLSMKEEDEEVRP